MRRRDLILLLGFVMTVGLGYWLAMSAVPEKPGNTVKSNAQDTPKRQTIIDDPAPKFRSGERPPSYRRDQEAIASGALTGQRTLVFKDQSALEDFLKRAGNRIKVMGRLNALNALKVGFLNRDDLASLLDGTEKESLVFPVDVPVIGNGTIQPGAVSLGVGLLNWLGIVGDNSTWGKGVRIAILDTGVTASTAFSSNINTINLVELPADPTKQDGHATAVASMIIGSNALTPGVAPSADILSVRIANDLGQSDSFLLSQGIVAAVDSGVQLINISMGSVGDSGLVKNAIEYANAAGVMIVAAVGNNGIDRVSYPAANDGVIAVGAVDAMGDHLDFSNTGTQVDLSAPGFGVNAAWPGDQAASVSGTSFSSPIVVGAIAALMSQPGNERLSAPQAYALLTSYLNDSGAAGADFAVGAGMPDIGRVLNAKTPGIYDAAVASQRILPPSAGYPNGQIEVLVQNRGTETLVNTKLHISTPAGVSTSNITTLPVNAVQTIRVPITNTTGNELRYDTTVSLSGGLKDSKPTNDRRIESYVPTVSH